MYFSPSGDEDEDEDEDDLPSNNVGFLFSDRDTVYNFETV